MSWGAFFIGTEHYVIDETDEVTAGHQYVSDFHVYDTTMRDGAQQEGLNLSVQDKLHIARHLDDLGVGFIEGGWPGVEPQGHRVLRARAPRSSTSSTPRWPRSARPGAPTSAPRPRTRWCWHCATRARPSSCLVAKSHDRHVEQALRTTLEENLAMVRDTVDVPARARASGSSSTASTSSTATSPTATTRSRSCATAADAGAEVVVLCDTNGGMLPHWVGEIVAEVWPTTGARSASTRTTTPAAPSPTPWPRCTPARRTCRAASTATASARGNADLITCVANLELKLGMPVLPEGKLAEATRISHAIAEITNYPPSARQPYTGVSAFAHKAGLHASAIRVDPNLYQHIDPALVGNDMRLLVSEMAGRATIELKGKELGYDLADDAGRRRAGHRPGQGDGAGRLHVRGRRCVVRAAAGRGDGGRAAVVLRRRVVAGASPSRARDGDDAVAEATVKLTRRGRAARRHRRGQRSGQRARPRAAAGDRAGLSRTSRDST